MVVSPGARFPKSLRLLNRSDFQRVFNKRKSVASKSMVVYAARNSLPHSRIGLVVSRKVGNAVVRNRWKRHLREAFRQQQHTLPQGWDFVVLPRGDRCPTSGSVASDVLDLAQKVVRKATKSEAGKKGASDDSNGGTEQRRFKSRGRGQSSRSSGK